MTSLPDPAARLGPDEAEGRGPPQVAMYFPVSLIAIGVVLAALALIVAAVLLASAAQVALLLLATAGRAVCLRWTRTRTLAPFAFYPAFGTAAVSLVASWAAYAARGTVLAWSGGLVAGGGAGFIAGLATAAALTLRGHGSSTSRSATG